ncbi:MAG TPA: sulfatase-like hydrolase/transferase [Vicinamibacterales bacterium]|nr:sulfatase-like hydrolase/transferase [Vicinamibacterales bacterium]
MTRRRHPRVQKPALQYSSSSSTPGPLAAARRSPLLAAAVAIVFSAICGAAGIFIWTRYVPHAVTSVNGEPLGHLPPGVAAARLNLLLITLDTTRADRIHAYGFDGIETPNLDRLAREGVLFEQAVAPAPLTLPAHSSIFTGQFPPAHGVRDNGGFFLDDRETTLAERLQARGFATGGFVGAYVLDHKWGIAQGFQTYFDDFDLTKYQSLSLASVDRPGNEVADRALAWLDTVRSSRFFGWVHFYDAHSPYTPPEPFKSRYANRPYIGEIAFVDSQVGRLLAYLDDYDLARNTIVVVMGDHGESLGEHGEGTHGFFVYQATMHVPLLIRAPYDAMSGRRVTDTVRSIDILPTTLELLGIKATDRLEGTSVVPLMTGSKKELGLAAYSEAIYPRFHFGWSDLRALTAGRYKFVAAPRPELYDLQQDPTETKNIYSERQALGDRLNQELVALEGQMTASASPGAAKGAAEIDPEARERLAALGYVGTFVTTTSSDRAGLSDPKDKIQLFNLLTRARETARHDKESDEGLHALERVVEEDPKVIDAWFMMGNEYYRRKDYPRAIDRYKRALELKPDYDLVVINMANAYRALGRDEEAMVGYRRFMELDPKNAQIRYEAAQILIDNGKLEDAQVELTHALELEPKLAAARNALGVLALRRGDTVAAERDIRAAIAEKPDVRLAHFNLALLAEQQGDVQRAIAEYTKEMELHANSYKAAFNLGKVYERVGDRRGQIESFRKANEMNPSFAEGHLFLAKAYLDGEQNLEEAMALAHKGLELAPHSEYAPLGHYVIADILSRQGRRAEAEQEASRGRALERRARP